MIINNNYSSNLNFTSKLNPIKPLKLKTEKGKIQISELSGNDLTDKAVVREVVDMFCRNFIRDTDDPAWFKYQYKEYKKLFSVLKKQFVEDIFDLVKKDDGNLSIVVARNSKRKICGGIVTRGFSELPQAKMTTLYVDNLAVDRKYRGSGLAKTLTDLCLNSANEKYTDAFVVSSNRAIGFYEKLNFKILNALNENENRVINFMKSMRFDVDMYVTPMSKVLNGNEPRWYDRLPEYLKCFDF